MTDEPAFDPKRSRALLIGCARYPYLKQEGFGDLGSVPHSLNAMNDLLDEWGLPGQKRETISDRNGQLTADLVREAVRNAAQKSNERSDLLLVYFSGHGYTVQPDGLHLALSPTVSFLDAHGSIPFRDIANTLQNREVWADHIFVILDCCHAGAAVSHVRPVLHPPGETGREITLLVAADDGFQAKSPREDAPSFFTGAFVDAARKGSSRLGPHLRLSDLAQAVKQRADEHNKQLGLRDVRQRMPIPLTLRGLAADYPWLPNRGHKPADVPAESYAPPAPVLPVLDQAPKRAAETVPKARKAAPTGLRWPSDYLPPSRPLVSRPNEFGRLQIRSRPGCVVPITGEPGVGKKWLTEMFLYAPEGARAAVSREPYVLQLDLDPIRCNSPAPALRALQFALALDRYKVSAAEDAPSSLGLAELREYAAEELARRVAGRPLVVYISFRTTRSERRKVHDDLERLLAYPVFRYAVILVVSTRELDELTGAGQLLPSAAVDVPPLDLDQAAELLRLLLEERRISGIDPAAALRLSGEESIALRPRVLAQSVAALDRRLAVSDAEPQDGMLADDIRHATRFVVGPALLESGCRLEEDSEPGALSFLLAWAQLGSSSISTTGLPQVMRPLHEALPWLRKSGVLVNCPQGGSGRVVISPAAEQSFKEIYWKLQSPPDTRHWTSLHSAFLLGNPEPTEARADELVGRAMAYLLDYMYEFAGVHGSDSDSFVEVRALERALNELDERPKGTATADALTTRSIVVTELLIQSDDALILPVDLEEAQAELAGIHRRISHLSTHKSLSGVRLCIAQMNVLSRLPTETAGIQNAFSELLTQIWREITRRPLLSHEDINTLDKLTLLTGRRLDAVDDLVDFRKLVLEYLVDIVTYDYSRGRVSRILALMGWGLATAEISDSDDIRDTTIQRVWSLIESLEEPIKATPSGGLRDLLRRFSILQAKASWDPQGRATHLIEAWRHTLWADQLRTWREHEKVLVDLLQEESAEQLLATLLITLLTAEDDTFEEMVSLVARWRAAAQVFHSYGQSRTELSAEARLAALEEIGRCVRAMCSSAADRVVIDSFLVPATALAREALGGHREVLRDLRALKASLDQALAAASDWMVLKGWLTVVLMLRERSWSPSLVLSAGPALERWFTEVRGAADAKIPDNWRVLRGFELLHEAESPLALPGPRIFDGAIADGQVEETLRDVYRERRSRIDSFGEDYGHEVTWFRMCCALESRALHEQAAATGQPVDASAVERIQGMLEGRQPNPQNEYALIRARDHLAAWRFSKAAKTAQPRHRNNVPAYRAAEFVRLRVDALLREALWLQPAGEDQRRLLETARRELAESPHTAPAHWCSVLRLRTARAHTPTLLPRLGAVDDLNALFTAQENAGFLELAAALADLGERGSDVDRQPFVSALEDAGGNTESVFQLGLFHLEQAEWLCGLTPLMGPVSIDDLPAGTASNAPGLTEERIADSLRSAWSCFNAVVWLDSEDWPRRVDLAMGQGRVLATAKLVWGDRGLSVLDLGREYPVADRDLGRLFLDFATRHSISRCRAAAKRLSHLFN